MPKAKRRLKNFDFSDDDAHVALVDAAANGLKVLLTKRFGDMEKFDNESGEFVPLQESGLTVNMSLEDMLMFFTDLFPEDIETLTAAINKAADGKELEAILEAHIKKTGALPFDVFTARREAFKDRLEKLDTGAMDALRSASIVINEFLDRGIKPGDADSGSPSAPDLVEKTAMTKKDEGKTPEDIAADLEKKAADDAAALAASKNASEAEVPASVQKSLDEQSATITKQAETIETLQKAEDARVLATFITKAKGFAPLGLPAVEESKEAETEFGLALKALSEANPDAYAQVESVLTKALDTINKGENLKAVGGDGQPEPSDKSTDLKKAADKLKEADPSLTDEQAITKALDANSDLYEG